VGTTADLVAYYKNLLIMQYAGKPKAAAHVAALVGPFLLPQTCPFLTFSAAPDNGTFTVSYNGNTSAAINAIDSLSSMQTKIRAVPGLSGVTVTGSTGTGLSLVGAPGVTVTSSLIDVFSNPVSISIGIATDDTKAPLPQAVRDAFNLLPGTVQASGAQLDTLGKYVGVTRNGLVDADYLTLIRLAIISNSSDSSLAGIQALLQEFFPGQLAVYDYRNMQMSYLIATSLGSLALVKSFIAEGMLPKPAAVSIAAPIYAPTINTFFGCRTYAAAGVHNSPLNTYASYQTTRPCVTYAMAVVPS
jgi:hypothetical protein